MYALINTMTKIENDSIGTVISLHRTVDAAERANDKLQRLTKRANGGNSYLPTRVVEVSRRFDKGQHVSPCYVEL